MPEMPELNWNQTRGRENHEQLRPALLHVNADSFGEKNCRIKQRQETRRPHCTVCEDGLEFVKQPDDGAAVLEQDFIRGPVRQRIHPASPRVQKKQ